MALTGYGQESDRRRALDGGFARHVVKPPMVAVISEILATVGLPEPS